jgi:hypothetical protein
MSSTFERIVAAKIKADEENQPLLTSGLAAAWGGAMPQLPAAWQMPQPQ